MVYDHHEKAGNPGDVIKHVALIAAANVLMQMGTGTFHYADTYSGYAYNPIRPDGEWRNGIGKVYDGNYSFSNPDISFWKELWDCRYGLEGSVYPGSSSFFRKLCLKNGINYKPRLWDVSPSVISQLQTFYREWEAEIYSQAATPEFFRRGLTDLLLIDPPDFADVDKALDYIDLVENFILWLPITTENGLETLASSDALRKCEQKKLSIYSVRWDGTMNTRGCRLAYKLAGSAEEALLAAVSEITHFCGWTVSGLTGPN